MLIAVARNFFVFSKLQGGMKAVVWTDAFQAIIMVAGMLTVITVVRFQPRHI